ncbi:Cytochrome P450 2B5 [Bulinus truncatus]|nr:Cytochrome P450 2B5 [Bulinus truncatus]
MVSRVIWSGALYSQPRHMVRCVIWSCVPYDQVPDMVMRFTWSGASHGPVRHMVRCVTWSGAPQGQVRHMIRCVLWSGASCGHVRPMNVTCIVLVMLYQDTSLSAIFFSSGGQFQGMYPLLIALALCLIAYLHFSRRGSRLPPCPSRPLPVLGHILSLTKGPRDQMRKWREQTGDIFSMYMGGKLVVVLNGYDVIKEALVKQSEIFSDRPCIYVDQIVGVPNSGIMASSGANWKEQRSVSLSILKSFGMGNNSMAEKILKEVDLYLTLLDSYNGKPVDIRVITGMSSSNVVLSILLGQRFEYDDPVFHRLIDLMNFSVKYVEATSLLHFFPSLRLLPGDLFHAKKMKRYTEELHELLGGGYIKVKGYDDYDENGVDSFIAAYVKEKNARVRSGEATFLDDQSLVKIIVELFGAGMETTSSTILWCVLYVLHHPHVQEKIHHEMDSVVGRVRAPGLHDKTSLPYINAVILETQRLASVVPLNAPHLCSKDTTLRGFFIPKGTSIMPVLDSVLHDEKLWGEDVRVFRPERFIDCDGCLLHTEHMIPFSVGKRLCLGESIAKMYLFLALASMFQRFSFHPEDVGSPPAISEIFGIVAVPGPYKVRIINRQKQP